MTLHEHVRAARAALVGAGIPGAEAALDAELLARHVLGWDRPRWIARARDEAPPGFDLRLAALIDRRLRREPVAYIRGVQEFWGREFQVGSGVLVPRPETELVIEEALAWARDRNEDAAPRVLDIGTGSGCLGITLALELPASRVFASDISPAALAMARANAVRLGASVTFMEGAGTAGMPPPVDLLVSNPPYVTSAEHEALQPEVREHEPAIALVGGADGLSVIREVVGAAASVLAPGGRLLMEIGHSQAEAVRSIVANTEGLSVLRVRNDLQGIARLVVAARR